MLVVAALSLLAIGLYQTDGAIQPGACRNRVWPQVLPVQLIGHPVDEHAVLHGCHAVLLDRYVLARGEGDVMSLIGSRLVWVAVGMALIRTMVRWYESYLLGADIGHIPVSNLYEVFVMFCWMTALFYLYYEEHYDTRPLGIVMLVVSGRGLLLGTRWCATHSKSSPWCRHSKLVDEVARTRQFHWIRYVCAVGHGLCLPDQAAGDQKPDGTKLAPLWLLGVVLCFEPLVFRQAPPQAGSSYWMVYFGVSALIVAGILLGRKRIGERLPSFEVLDDLMYKSIAVGFAFSPLPPCWGLWAAEAWGGYWSWDPKGNLGADRLAQLCSLAAHAPDEGLAGARCRPGGRWWAWWSPLCVPRCQYVPERPAQLRDAVKQGHREVSLAVFGRRCNLKGHGTNCFPFRSL